jgi:hypothetical protein
MFVPKKWHWVLPPSMILVGFYIRTQYGAHWDVHLFVQVPLSVVAAELGAYLWQAGVAYQKYVTGGAQIVEPKSPEIIDWNTGKPVDGLEPINRAMINTPAQVYNHTSQRVVFDAERLFAKTLINMRNHNFKIRMDETYWIKEKRYSESREAFVGMLEKWEYYGLSGREGGQNKRVPKDWRKIRLVAQGEKLPPPPRKVL